MKSKTSRSIIAILVAGFVVSAVAFDTRRTIQSPLHQPQLVRLYIFDCGILENIDTKRFGLNKEEVAVNRLSVPCFLVVHPKGTLIWDAGMVPDLAWKPTGNPVT